jgi:hypothetical protein
MQPMKCALMIGDTVQYRIGPGTEMSNADAGNDVPRHTYERDFSTRASSSFTKALSSYLFKGYAR